MANANIVKLRLYCLYNFVTSLLYPTWFFVSIAESTPSYSGIDDEDIEEEFKKLELELESENPQVTIPKTGYYEAAEETLASESADLSVAFSSLGLKDGPAEPSPTQNSVVPARNNESKHPMLEAA